MDIKQLRAILAVAETGSTTKAAERLHIVQPAVSRHIRLLEEELGVELFERERHGMLLTDAGKTLAEYGRRALRELDRARAEIQPAAGLVSGTADIGLLPSCGELLAPELVATLRGRHPQLGVRLTAGYAGHFRQWLESGDVDAALMYDDKSVTGLQVQALLDEQLYLMGRPSTVPQAGPLSIMDLEGLALVLPNPPHGLRNVVEHAFAVSGIDLVIAAETNSLSVQKSLVAKGFAHTILPSSAISDDLARAPWPPRPLPRRPCRSPHPSCAACHAHPVHRRLLCDRRARVADEAPGAGRHLARCDMDRRVKKSPWHRVLTGC